VNQIKYTDKEIEFEVLENLSQSLRNGPKLLFGLPMGPDEPLMASMGPLRALMEPPKSLIGAPKGP
jgi:hypothetical protein